MLAQSNGGIDINCYVTDFYHKIKIIILYIFSLSVLVSFSFFARAGIRAAENIVSEIRLHSIAKRFLIPDFYVIQFLFSEIFGHGFGYAVR